LRFFDALVLSSSSCEELAQHCQSPLGTVRLVAVVVVVPPLLVLPSTMVVMGGTPNAIILDIVV
jgi:hypothetical protein